MTDERQQSWDAALEMLRSHVPQASGFDPDDIDLAAKANGKPLDWRKLDRSDLEDRQVWGVIASQLNWDPQATMTVVADACYGKGLGPMKMRFGDFEQWLEQFAERYNDEVFGGDAVLLCEEGLVVVHHEGIFAILLKAFVIG